MENKLQVRPNLPITEIQGSLTQGTPTMKIKEPVAKPQ
jgi:hypothetical protein